MFSRNRRSDLRRPRNERRPRLETLEGRQLMSLGSEFLLNTTTHNDQFDSDNAKSGNGTSVAVWTDFSTNSDHVIRAQLLGFEGRKQGPEIVVAHIGRDDFRDAHPRVAMDSLGEFVVTWAQSNGASGSAADTNVLAQRFNANGTPRGGVVSVGVGTFKEHDPDVAFGAFGSFVVSYTRDTNNNNPDIFAKSFSFNDGHPLQVFSVATSSKAEDHSSVATAGDGTISVAYQLQFNSSDDDVKLSRFTAGGVSLGTTTIAGSTAREQLPSISEDGSGNAVVAYQKFVGDDFDIKARRVSPSGVVGSEINIQNGSANETRPSVALRRGPLGGGFVVAYNSSDHVKVSEVSASNVVVRTSDAGSQRSAPAVSIDGNGEYLLTDTSAETFPFPFPVVFDRNIRGRVGRLS